MITIGHIGAGYWGPNLLRNFADLNESRVKICCDLREEALAKAQKRFPEIAVTTDYKQVLTDPEIDAVVVASSAVTHYQLAKEALEHDKHVFVEKPIALAVAEAAELVELAEQRARVLMVGHLLEYHPAVTRLKEYVDSGELGETYYVYSNRLNLGKVRQDENAMWSLAPHDISIILYLLGSKPQTVSAQGHAYLQPGIQDTVFLFIKFADGKMAHCHVSWLDPHKVRRVVVVGDKKMAVFDDMESTEKLRIYDKGVNALEYRSYGEALSLRFGDIYIPRIKMEEPLRLECQHFLDCVRDGKTPRSDGRDGLRVLQVLEAGQRSLDNGGVPVEIEWG